MIDRMLAIENPSDELVAKSKARAKELGFSTVSDYIVHLILTDNTKKTGDKLPKLIPSNQFELDERGVKSMASMMNDLKANNFIKSSTSLYSLEEIYKATCVRYPIVKMTWDEMSERNRDDLAIQFKYLVENKKSAFEKSAQSSGGYSMYKLIG